MAILIGSVGMTPQVVTEATRYLGNVELVHLIDTKSSDVDKYEKFLKKYLEKEMKIHLQVTRLDREDITSNDDLMDYITTAMQVIDDYTGKERYCLISGGRKSMSVALVLAGQIAGCKLAVHVTHKPTASINPNWERYKSLVDKYLDGSISEEEKLTLDNLMIPPADVVDVIKLPILPLPRNYLNTLITAVRENRPSYAKAYLNDLRIAGWLTSTLHFTDYELLRRLLIGDEWSDN